MMEDEIPSTSSAIKTDNDESLKRPCTLGEKEYVSEKIKSSELRSFTRFLGLEESKIDAVETDCKGLNYGFRETVYQMMVTWEQIKGSEATVEVLISALNCIQRNDIVQHLFPDFYQRNQQSLSEAKGVEQNKSKFLDSLSNIDIFEFAKSITRNQLRPLAEILGLNEWNMKEIDMDSVIYNYTDEEIACNILYQWKRKTDDPRRSDLETALQKLNSAPQCLASNQLAPEVPRQKANIQTTAPIPPIPLEMDPWPCKRKNEDEASVFKRPCTRGEKDYVADEIKSSEFRNFARFLGLEESEIHVIEMDCKANCYGFRETVYLMLLKWEEIKGCEATVNVLIAALNSIQRNDIVQHLFPDYYQRNHQYWNKYLQEMQQTQKTKYRYIMLPRTLWLTEKILTLEELYVELTMKKKDKWGKEEDISIQRDDIFYKKEIEENVKVNNQKNDGPCRILVEGHPGYGKTTLISKLLFDWSREKKYVRDKFDLVFVIPLRNFKGNLENHLLQQIENVSGSDEDKLEAIKEVEGRVLLLLDGLDECNERIKESLLPLFSGDQYPHMTVLVTCRTGFIHFEQESDDNSEIMGNTGFEYHLIWNKRIEIKGILPEKRLEFLRKYLNINFYVMERKFEQFYFDFNNLYECPLFLLLFALFAKERKLDTIQTKTELYKRMFNFVLNRNLNRENRLEEEFNVFDDKLEDNFGYRKYLIIFGRLCLEKIKKESFLFEERELLECSGRNEISLKLRAQGFYSKELYFDNYEEEKYYEPIHKSFVQFLAAFYLSFLNEAELKREIKELTVKFDIWPDQDQLLYSFLGGLLQENACKLFNSFYPYTCVIRIFQDDLIGDTFYYLDDILTEIPENDEIYKSIVPFVSTNWKQIESSSVIKRWRGGFLDFLQRTEIPNNIILCIPNNLDSIKYSPVLVNTVEIDFTWFDYGVYSLEVKEIKCHKLIVCCKGIKYDLKNELKVVFSKIKADKIFLLFDSTLSLEEKSKIIPFYELITGTNFQNYTIGHLAVKITKLDLTNEVLTLIEDLVERNKIETGIDIEFFSEDLNRKEVEKVNSFLDFVFKSHLAAVILTNTGDTSITLKMNEKHWNYIKLSGNSININSTEINSFSVEHLDIRSFYLEENNWNWLRKCTNLKRLQCDISLIFELSKVSKSDWCGFDTLEFLDIDLDWCEDWNIKFLEFIPSDQMGTFLSVISRFKNLREIKTPLHECQEYLVELLSQVSSIKKICLCNSDFYGYFSALKIFEKQLSVKDEKVEIELRMYEYQSNATKETSSSNDFFEVLEKCSLNNVFVSFSFPVPDEYDETHELMRDFFPIRHSMCKYFLSRDGFKVCLTHEEDRYCPFEYPFKFKIKMSIIYERPDKIEILSPDGNTKLKLSKRLTRKMNISFKRYKFNKFL